MCTETPTAFVGVIKDTKLGLNSTANTVYVISITIKNIDINFTPSIWSKQQQHRFTRQQAMSYKNSFVFQSLDVYKFFWYFVIFVF